MFIEKTNSTQNQTIATKDLVLKNSDEDDVTASNSIYDLAKAQDVKNVNVDANSEERQKSFFGELLSAIGDIVNSIISFIFGGSGEEQNDITDIQNNQADEINDIEEEPNVDAPDASYVEENTDGIDETSDITNEETDSITDNNSDTVPKYNDFKGDFDTMLGYVFDFEGGYGNIPEDRGGATNYGITQGTYDYWNDRHGVERKDVVNITKEEAKEIYYNDFYLASGADEYVKKGDNAYAFLLFDSAVNHGVGAAYDFDNEAQGDPDKFMEVRKQFYIDIVANDPSQAIFEEGWQNRWNKVYSIINKDHEYEDYT